MTDVSVAETPPVTDTAAAVEANNQAAAEELYAELKPFAELAGRAYITARMPPDKAALVMDKIDADFPAPAEPAPSAPETPPAGPTEPPAEQPTV